MIASRGMNFMELDKQASTAEQPYGIITADCSDPREIDDGVFVQQLDAGTETYRVGVCVADTSKLYDNGDIRRQAMANGSAKYWNLPNDERGYDPMIPAEVIKDLEFTKDTVRNALILSFIVGKSIPPSDLTISYGKVRVITNLTYRDFADKCASKPGYRKFAAASALIRSELDYNPGGDHTKALANNIRVPVVSSSQRRWLNGARMNEAFMVASNYLVGQLLNEEGRPAIYRLHDPLVSTFDDFLTSNVARYSMTPGRHAGLNLKAYCRTTSPLRRLEDFMMAQQLKRRHEDKPATQADQRHLEAAVRRLNQEIAIQALNASGALAGYSRAGIRQVRQPDTEAIVA